MFGSKVFSAVVVTSTLLAGVEAVCMTVPFRTGVGRDTGKYDDKSMLYKLSGFEVNLARILELNRFDS